jgi:glycosyltransferase involved in cell wall biosynthesis
VGIVRPGPLVLTASGYFVKVLHVIPSVAPRYGGPSRAVVEMCAALRQLRVETLIATTDADGDGSLHVELGREILYKGVPAIFFKCQWSEAYKYSRSLARWLDRHVREFDAVHIHAVFSHACLAAARACRRRGVPYIVRPLGSIDPWSLKQKLFRKRLFWHLGVKRMLHGAAAIHYTAQAEQEAAETTLGLKRGVVIPLGIEIQSAHGPEQSPRRAFDPSSTGEPYVLVLSRLHPKKGLELLLNAFLPLVKQPEFAGWRLVMAGEGEAGYVASLQHLVKKQQGNGSVIFAGWLDGAQKSAALQDAALLALPSFQENFGLCVIEALACGVPVLVSRQVNLAPLIEAASAGWVTSLEPAQLSHTLTDALRDSDARARRGNAGRELVNEKFTWPAVASELIALYQSLG